MSVHFTSSSTSLADLAPPVSPPTRHASDNGEQPVVRHLTVHAWVDPLVDERGHDPRSRYVELFWLGVLGPTATWLIRRLAIELARQPDGTVVDLEVTAASMGLKFSPSRSSPFSRALQRCVMFGLAHPLPDGGLAVRRRIPPVSHRHVRRMPEYLQAEHARWRGSSVDVDEFARAHQLAIAMVEAGDDHAVVEHQLHALGVASIIAAQVADNVARL